MEATFQDGGRQYTVREGATLDLDYRDAEPGTTLEFDDVLYVRPEGAAPRVGTPKVEGARVIAQVIGEAKGPKLVVMHFRRRKNSRSRTGHRQHYTQVKIQKIEA